jgi:hypothetical protein
VATVTSPIKASNTTVLFTWQFSEYKIRWRGDGHLHCIGPDHAGTDVTWCDHIERMVKTSEDAESIWSDDLDDFDMEYVLCMVPMMPTLNVWCAVKFLPIRAGLMVAYFYRDIAPDIQVELGYISPGEGRMTLRSMVKENFEQFWLTYPDSQCVDSMHNMVAQRAWTTAQKAQDNSWFLERWMVFMTGKCMTCALGTVGSFDDVIPF